jgi:hypothetical protein
MKVVVPVAGAFTFTVTWTSLALTITLGTSIFELVLGAVITKVLITSIASFIAYTVVTVPLKFTI